jgi:hypothetical protein
MNNQANLPTVSELLFDKRPTAAINIETLSKSATHLTVSGNLPATRPVHHYQFLTWMQQEMEDRLGDEVIIEPINISSRHANRIRISPDEVIDRTLPCPIERLNIQRLVTRIILPKQIEMGGDKFNPSFAISYTDKGIEISYGTNVFACANMNIFGSSRWSTYGSARLNFEDFKTLIKAKMDTWHDAFDVNLHLIEQLQNKPMTLVRQRQEVSKIFESAVTANLAKKKDNILNITQTVKLQEEILAKRIGLQSDSMTWWDFTQAGTEHLKSDRQDMVSLFPTIQNFNNHVINEADLYV